MPDQIKEAIITPSSTNVSSSNNKLSSSDSLLTSDCHKNSTSTSHFVSKFQDGVEKKNVSTNFPV